MHVRDNVQWRWVDAEIVILDLETSRYYGLNGSAALLWQALSNGAGVAELESLLTSRYGIRGTQAHIDVAAFLGDVDRFCVDLA